MARHRRHGRSTNPVRRFVRTYGWRAYALPVLTVLTIVTLMRSSGGTAAPAEAAARSVTATVTAVARPTERAGGAATSLSPAASSSNPPQVMAVRGAGVGTAPAAGTARVSTAAGGAESDGTGACASNTHPTLVVVSIGLQHAWMCEGGRQVASTPVTTGDVAAGDATPTGTWLVQDKQTDRYLVGPGYRDYVHFWVPFNGDFGFHDAPWQTFPFGSADYRTEGSHGCVHLPAAAMAWLYGWARVGSTVVTIEA